MNFWALLRDRPARVGEALEMQMNEGSEMFADRNKTDLTRKLTDAAAAYLSARGFKPIETEVPIEQGWVADIAAPCDPTPTELIALGLLRRAPRWSQPEAHKQWKIECDAKLGIMTALVEVKTSRPDFCGDQKWKREQPTNLAYVAVPDEMIREDEYPVNWGVLVFDGEQCRLSRVPNIVSVTAERQRDVIHAVAIRRDHHTRHARMREFRRQACIQQSESVSRTRVFNAVQAVMDIVKGMPVERALATNRIKAKCIPKYYWSELEQLQSLAPQQETGASR
jgi:hypothetical protein